MGKILNVDLSNRRVKEEELNEEICNKFIGGYGLGCRLIYSRQKAKVSPLSAESYFGIMTGPLTGTPALTGSRFTAIGKSPLTGTWGDANSGGYFGVALKRSGYDGVLFSGISDKPVYLYIENGKAEVRDASDLWGKDTFETEEIIKNRHGEKTEVACIGQSGEELSLISAIMSNKGRAAARSGLGAIMGSKRLKAIAAKGDMEIKIANKEDTENLRKEFLEGFKGHLVDVFRNFGTCGVTAVWTKAGETPVKNYGGIAPVDFPNPELISDSNVIKYLKRKYACYRCPVACGGIVSVKEGGYQLDDAKKPEHETLAAFGNMCLNDNVESIIKANDICNRYGIDTISAGVTIAFAIECFENGIITLNDTDEIELRWGNHESIVKMTEKLAKREGFGDVLADGVKKASEKIGNGSEEFAIHIAGQEVPMRDPKHLPGIATTYKMDPTPARHTRGGAHWAEGVEPKGIDIKPHDKYSYSGKAENHKKLSNYMHILSSSGLCMFGQFLFDTTIVPKFLSSVTGWNISMEEALKRGERIANMLQAFNIREGINPLKFRVPGRVTGSPPQPDGPNKDVTVDLDTQIKEYLIAMDWNIENAKPSKDKLIELELDDLINDLYES